MEQAPCGEPLDITHYSQLTKYVGCQVGPLNPSPKSMIYYAKNLPCGYVEVFALSYPAMVG